VTPLPPTDLATTGLLETSATRGRAPQWADPTLTSSSVSGVAIDGGRENAKRGIQGSCGPPVRATRICHNRFVPLVLATAHLSDDEFLEAFHCCRPLNSEFHHADHLRCTGRRSKPRCCVCAWGFRISPRSMERLIRRTALMSF